MMKPILIYIEKAGSPKDAWTEAYWIPENMDPQAFGNKRAADFTKAVAMPSDCANNPIYKVRYVRTKFPEGVEGIPHRWIKSICGTTEYDVYWCENCGITAKRVFFNFEWIRDNPWRDSIYQHCNPNKRDFREKEVKQEHKRTKFNENKQKKLF